jgi:hypothetical protein
MNVGLAVTEYLKTSHRIHFNQQILFDIDDNR